jgi:hypothetical protein
LTSRTAKKPKSGAKSARKSSKRAAPDPGATCPSCGAEVLPKARFCHACGASLGAAPAAAGGWDFKMLALVVFAAIAIVSVVFATVIIVTEDDTAMAPPRPAAAVGAGPVPTVDLSSLTPRQAADHLFNRVMMANEQGNVSEALEVAPMAVHSYEILGALDADAHYHLGLIHVVTGDFDKAREQIAKIKELVPDHLLGFTLEQAIAEQIGDQDAVARAYAAFAAAYDSEIAVGRSEYSDHRSTLERFRAAARANAN